MLTVITGPMFSGKSSKLISILISNEIAENYAVAIKPDIDVRYGTTQEISSHGNGQFPALLLPCNSPDYSIGILEDNLPDIIGFDEAQFFHKNRLLQSIKYFLTRGSSVVCAGLSQDSNGKPFGAMPTLLAIADEIISLKAVCSSCKGIGIATRTYRKTNDNDQVAVGGAEKYEARCFKCWKKTC